MKKSTKTIIFILLFSAAVAAAINWARVLKEYADADEKMAQAEKMRNEAIRSPAPEESINKPKKKEQMEKDSPPEEDDPYLYNRIDFASLTGVPPEDIYGWLYIPDTKVDYVVMKGESPAEYLWKDPYGESSKTGSLFLYPDIEEDDHKIIYGHRLKDHSLYFGELMNYKEPGFAEEHDTAYLYKEERAERYKLCCVISGLESDMVYLYPFRKKTPEYELLVKDIEQRAETTIKTLDQEKEMLILSTCSGKRANEPFRLYLVFQIDKTSKEPSL